MHAEAKHASASAPRKADAELVHTVWLPGLLRLQQSRRTISGWKTAPDNL